MARFHTDLNTEIIDDILSLDNLKDNLLNPLDMIDISEKNYIESKI